MKLTDPVKDVPFKWNTQYDGLMKFITKTPLLYGYKNVKGLSAIEITDKYELGEWERRAGYDKNGIIRPKKYWMVDLKSWEFAEEPGEITDF